MNPMSSGDYSSEAGHEQVKKCECAETFRETGGLGYTWENGKITAVRKENRRGQRARPWANLRAILRVWVSDAYCEGDVGRREPLSP
jgi:hypothetical protein